MVAVGDAGGEDDALVLVSARVFTASRTRVFEAFRDPGRLERWWGPAGFTNDFHEFDLRPGGQWRFDMVGPDGARYPNEAVFVEVRFPDRIVFDHLGPVHPFRLEIDLAEEPGGATRVTWRMRHETAATMEAVRPFVERGTEENFDRLQALLVADP